MVFCIRKVKVVFSLSHMNTTSGKTVLGIRSRMLFIFCTHFFWLVVLSCSVTPSCSAYCFASRSRRNCTSPSTSAQSGCSSSAIYSDQFSSDRATAGDLPTFQKPACARPYIFLILFDTSHSLPKRFVSAMKYTR